MEIGIAGPKSSGKTTVFSALTGVTAAAGSPSKTSLGVIKVPDARLDYLNGVFNPKKKVNAEIRFTDIQGRIEKERSQTGLDTQTTNALRSMEAIVLVVRAFTDPTVPAPPSGIDALKEFADFEEEMRITDFIQIEAKLERMKKENSKGQEENVLKKCHTHLESNKPLRLLSFSQAEEKLINGYGFLSKKPLLVLRNSNEDDLGLPKDFSVRTSQVGGISIGLSAKLENEVAQLPEKDQTDFCRELGIESPARDRFIQEAYSMLRLISFFTVGEDEVRAWPVERGTVAQIAAGRVHSDIERGFIRAAVVGYEDFVCAGSLARARELATLRQEGKTYPVKDGDIIEFKFNV